MRLRRPDIEDPDINVAALIDMTFLMLVYFMATATLIRSEADLGIRLPGLLAAAQQVDLPDEQTIEIGENGVISLNGQEFDDPRSTELPQLTALLSRYKLSAQAAKNEAMVTIWAHDNAKHQRVIDVMNACAKAGVKNVTFASGES